MDQGQVGACLLQSGILCLQVLQAFELAEREAAVLGLVVSRRGFVACGVADAEFTERPGTFSPRWLRPSTEMIFASLNRDFFMGRTIRCFFNFDQANFGGAYTWTSSSMI